MRPSPSPAKSASTFARSFTSGCPAPMRATASIIQGNMLPSLSLKSRHSSTDRFGSEPALIASTIFCGTFMKSARIFPPTARRFASVPTRAASGSRSWPTPTKGSRPTCAFVSATMRCTSASVNSIPWCLPVANISTSGMSYVSGIKPPPLLRRAIRQSPAGVVR